MHTRHTVKNPAMAHSYSRFNALNFLYSLLEVPYSPSLLASFLIGMKKDKWVVIQTIAPISYIYENRVQVLVKMCSN